MEWREVIHQYLIACVADSRRELPPSSRSAFIDAYGTTALKDRERENQAQSEKRVASQHTPLPETFKAIEESPALVVAEVEKVANHLELFHTLRFLVVKVENRWRLDDIFWKCTCDEGVCIICLGTGSCFLCGGKGFYRPFFRFFRRACDYCKGARRCNTCDGGGRCKYCLDSPIRGWRSRTAVIERI